MISRIFPNWFSADLHDFCDPVIACVVILFEGTSVICQFHDFFNLISGGVLLFGPTMVHHEAKDHNRETKVSF